jgi:hypothetical protein
MRDRPRIAAKTHLLVSRVLRSASCLEPYQGESREATRAAEPPIRHAGTEPRHENAFPDPTDPIMRLPNAERALVDLDKLRDDCLNPAHPRGRHKARVFASALGITARKAAWLSTAFLHAA